MSSRAEKVFYVLAYITQGSSYLSPRAYAIMHRMHHAYTDTEMDPHSPSYSKNLMEMMERTRKFYAGLMDGSIEVEDRFTKNLPGWDKFDRWADSIPSRLIWMGVYTALFFAATYFLHESYWWFLLLPVVFAMSPVHGAIINWYAHRYGYTNHEVKNTSKNLFSVDVLMLGESYHNNHHKHPSSINFGKKWHEVDPIYPIIRLLAVMRVIKLPNKAVMAAAKLEPVEF